MYLRYGDLSWDAVDTPEDDASRAPEEMIPPPTIHRRRSGRLSHAGPYPLPVVRLNGIELHAITEGGCIRYIIDELNAGRGGMVVTPNLDHLRRCVSDMSFGALVAEADLVVADGMPLVWASRLQGTPLPERVAGSDLVSSLSAAAAEHGQSIFMLGGAPGTAEAGARVLRERHPNIKIVGVHCPPMGFEKDESAVAEIIEKIMATRPRIIYVALGSPKQELLIHQLRQLLPDSWWLGVGNSFSFLSGDVRRAPLWMQKRGLEWIHRLVQEPKRLFKRYIIFGLPFAASLLTRSVFKGLPRRLRRPAREPDSQPARTPDPAAPKIEMPVHARQNGSVNRPAAGAGSSNGSNGNSAILHGNDRPAGRIAQKDSALARLRAVVLLGGSVRPTPLFHLIDRSVLDLPLDDDGTVLNHWLHHAGELARHAGIDELPVRLMVDRNSPEPLSHPTVAGRFQVERDLSEYRGTGGVLRDVAVDYNDDDLILIANAAQVLLDPLTAIAEALERIRGDVSLVSHQDGTPSGIMLMTCGALRLIPGTGFVDMKEQGLPAIADRYDVTVLNRRRTTGLPIRSLADYIMALRRYHRRRHGRQGPIDPLTEDWRPAFAIVEEGAEVDPLARVHDSVVLRGGRVEQGAVLVRSIVCPSGLVRRDRTAVDQFVTPDQPGRRQKEKWV